MQIGFLGAGKMAEAILSAMLDAEMVQPWEVTACDKSAERRELLASTYEVVVTDDPLLTVKESKVLILAVKPQDLDALLDRVAPALRKTHLVVSIAAGKTLKVLRGHLGPKPRLVRVMPNLALMAGEGMSVYCPDTGAKASDKALVARIFGAAGAVIQLEEKHFDAVTALSGSGPAYVAYFLKAMIDAGIALGLPDEAARLMGEQTLIGTGIYLQNRGQDLEAFIQAVCSPKGTTEAGMKVLGKSTVRQAVAKTLAATAKRSAELA
ncbi:MAG: pyrroline-5-carboxylate reductase [Kiritimatiellae bacterium]|nr:pyrroline-5-carboxylate reductase [Kiritimatiellia bacterium]